MIDCDDYDTTTALGTAEYFADVLETMIGESWFRTGHPNEYDKMHDLCIDMRKVVVDLSRQDSLTPPDK